MKVCSGLLDRYETDDWPAPPQEAGNGRLDTLVVSIPAPSTVTAPYAGFMEHPTWILWNQFNQAAKELALYVGKERPAEVVDRADKADKRADIKPKKHITVPRNNEVLRLYQLLEKEDGNGRSKKDIALEFTEGKQKKADSLLRSVRRIRQNFR